MKALFFIGSSLEGIRRFPIDARRVIYTASMGDAVYVLHAFVKKTQKTPQRDIELASKRFKQIGG